MPQSARRSAVHDQPHAYTRAHRDIGVIDEILRRAPAAFRRSRTINVGVDRHRHAKAISQRLKHGGIAPAAFRRGGNVPVVAGRRIELERAERGDADRIEPARLPPATQRRLQRRQCLVRNRGGHLDLLDDLALCSGEHRHAFRPAEFNPGDSP